MSFNFKRKYILTIEDDLVSGLSQEDTAEQERLREDYSGVIALAGDLSQVTTRGTVIENLHIEAQIDFNGKTSGSDPNKAEIKIYNLNKATRARVSQVNARIILEAGYEGNTHIVFTGQVATVSSEKVGVDVITSLSCKDGYTPLDSIRYTKAFNRDTPYTTIFQDMIDAFSDNKIPIGGVILDKPSPPLSDAPSDVITTKSWGYSGKLRDALTELCREFNYTYKIVHSKLYIYPNNYGEMFGEVTLDGSNILSIKKRQEGKDNVADKPNKIGIEVKLLLLGQIDLSTRIRVVNSNTGARSGGFDLSEYEGTYTISSMRHSLSYEGGEWYTILSCDGVEE